MHIGAFNFATDYSMDISELAREMEDRGYEALFLCEHTHIPTSRESPFPGGGDLPERYWHTHDPFVALSFAAAATTKLTLGTGICLISQRDPIVTAKCVASLDRLSNGRFILGMGAGWNKEEMANHGTAFEDRFKVVEDRARAMQALWTQEEAEYHGEFVDFDPVWSYPKPVQKPHPPIVLGGETVHTMRRVVDFCDGWFPRAGRYTDPVEGIAKLKEVADEAGRDMSSLSVTVFRAPPDAQTLESYAQAGITRVLLEVPSEDRDGVMRQLDDYQPLVS